jgi:hypothetical protein
LKQIARDRGIKLHTVAREKMIGIIASVTTGREYHGNAFLGVGAAEMGGGLYQKIDKLFPGFFKYGAERMELKSQDENSKPLVLEWSGSKLELARTNETGRHPMKEDFDPRVTFEIDWKNKELKAVLIENTNTGRSEGNLLLAEPDSALQKSMDEKVSKWLDKLEARQYAPVEMTASVLEADPVTVTFENGQPKIPEKYKNTEEYKEFEAYMDKRQQAGGEVKQPPKKDPMQSRMAAAKAEAAIRNGERAQKPVTNGMHKKAAAAIG